MVRPRGLVSGVLAAAIVAAGGAHAAFAGHPPHKSLHSATAARPALVRPVAVYVGHQPIASGLSLSSAVTRVRSSVPFTILTPRMIPAGFHPVQLSVTARQIGVSGGYSTLSFAKGMSGFTIQESSHAIAHVGGTRTSIVTVSGRHATLREFKMGHQDVLMLTGVTPSGEGYDVTTDSALSHLTGGTLIQVAASLH